MSLALLPSEYKRRRGLHTRRCSVLEAKKLYDISGRANYGKRVQMHARLSREHSGEIVLLRESELLHQCYPDYRLGRVPGEPAPRYIAPELEQGTFYEIYPTYLCTILLLSVA